jgi:phosphatidylglycerophosphate synthase
LFAVLDCADGMVARLKKNGTEFGRLIDGVVDYVVNIIVYFAIAICAYRNPDLNAVLPWYLAILAGVSKAIHSATFDKYLMEYIAYEKGDIGFIEKELMELKEKLSKTPSNDWKRIIAIKVYILYTKAQLGNTPKELKYDPNLYCQKNQVNLRLWGLIGPSFHITALVISMILMQPKWLLIYAIVFGNFWLVVMTLIQKQTLINLSKLNPSESAR